jgi:hypothetical protein
MQLRCMCAEEGRESRVLTGKLTNVGVDDELIVARLLAATEGGDAGES